MFLSFDQENVSALKFKTVPLAGEPEKLSVNPFFPMKITRQADRRESGSCWEAPSPRGKEVVQLLSAVQ
ncbi:hypothetical protein RSSM_06870 [Rhodopirellula sallentina SM41]|uniref:Uncharacterized protein n=1 Tax=Rhodopirellula sallentina SM41 TaxID=1263870 RepID=M5U712_9BACT|nr:hypothetical protein RSSM_06870 [Rhodopirellula sallentina SM41]